MKNLISLLILISLSVPVLAQEALPSKKKAVSIFTEKDEKDSKQTSVINISEQEQLLKTDKACALAANSSDMERLWSCWDDDAIMLMSTEFQVKGKKDIKAFTIRSREDPNFQINWIPQKAYVSPHGDMGYTYGNGTISRSGKNGEVITMTEPYLSVWKKDEEGNWKVMIEN